jgi:hypothetical protein
MYLMSRVTIPNNRRPQFDAPRRVGDRMLLAAIVAVLAGCNSVSTRFVTGLSAEERARADELPVFPEGDPPGRYQRVGPVEGFSCQITRDDSYQVSEDNALKELRRATVKAGGDAVTEVACQPLDRRQSTRGCFRSVVCQGTAVKVTQ